jgi:TRAP-type C4-dicarboxylate transport system substrate-binding protein
MSSTPTGRRLALMNRVGVLLVAALAFAVPAASCGFGGSERVGGERAAKPRVLTMLNPFTSSDELTAFADEVERLSNGALRIRIIPAGHASRPDFEAATIRDVLHGRADLAMAASRAWDEFGVRSLRALHAPLLIDSYPLQERVLKSDLVDQMLAELRPLDLVGIGILPGAIRHPIGLRHRLAAPRDFSGLAIGVTQSRVAEASMRALGARPVRLPAEVLTADGLQGIEHLVGAIYSNSLDIDGSHLMTNVDLWPRPLVLVAGSRAYSRLSAEQRRILRTAAANVVPKALTLVRNTEAEASGNICRRGGATFDAATSSELRALRLAVEPVFRDLERHPATRAAIEAIERHKAELGEPPADLASCERAAEPPASDATAIDGVWRMDTDREAVDYDYYAENWGRWTYVFDRGRFAITQENGDACTWGYGTFAVDGNRMSWTFTDGGGIAPTGASNKPGEFFVFGFSAYRDTLTVTPVKGEISPLNFRAKPWRRIATIPTRRFFSKRCPPPHAALRR